MGIQERRELGAYLRHRREGAGLDPDTVAVQLGWPAVRIERLELGLVTVRRADLRELLCLYGAEVEVAPVLLEGTRGWWTAYSDEIDVDYETLLILEESAVRLRTYSAGLIPGLLQTRGYAAGLMGTRRDQPWPRMQRFVELRLARARVLGTGSLEMVTVIDEAALHRPVGGSAEMRHQFEHLITMARRPGVTILVRPFTAEPFREARFTFHIFDLPADAKADASAVQLEEFDREHFEWNTMEVARYRRAFARAECDALDPAASVEFISGLVSRL